MARRGSKLGTSVLDLDIDDSKFHSKMANAYKAGQQFTANAGANLMKAGKAISGVGDSMTRNITLPILAAGGAVTKFGLDFDTTLRQVVGLTDVTAEEIGGIREELIKLGPEVGKSPQELAEAFYFVSSAGFEAQEAMEVLRTSARAAAAGLGETQNVAQVLGSVINAYGKENITAARAADILVEAISQGTAEAPEFAAVIGRVAPTAASLGVAFEEVAAALAGMTLTGLSAEESATSLNQVLVSLLKPTTQAEEAMKGLGLSSEGLRRQLREEGLLATLRTLEERFGANSEAAATVFGNVRALRGVTSLLGLDTEQLNAVFEKVTESAGRLGEAYEETEGPQREIDRAMADLQATAIELGTDVLPVVVDILKQIAGGARALAEWWSTLDDGTKKLIVQTLAFIAVAGPVIAIVGRLTTGAGMLLKGIGFLTGAKGLPLLIKNLGGLRIAAGLAAAAMVGAVPDTVDRSSLNRLQDLGNTYGDVQDAIEDLQQASDELTAGKGLFGQSIYLQEARAADLLAAAWDAGATSLEEATARVKAALVRSAGDIDAALLDLADGVEDGMSDVGDKVGEGMAKGVDAAALEAAGLPPELASILAEGAGDVEGGADTLTDPIAEAATAARKAAVEAMRDMLNEMISILADDPDALRAPMQELFDRLDDPYTDAERKADIAGQLAAKALRTALRTDDSGLISDAVARVEDLLSQYELIEPGALESGKAVNPALQKGIDANLDEMLTWLQDNVIGEVTGKFDLAQKLEGMGYDGLAAYVRGLRQQEIEIETAAIEAAKAAVRGVQTAEEPFRRSGFTAGVNLGDGVYDARGTAQENARRFGVYATNPLRTMPSWSWGYNVGIGFGNGLGSFASQSYVNDKARQIKSGVQRILEFAGSPPYTHAIEIGQGVGMGWGDGILRALRGVEPQLAREVGGIGGMLDISPNLPAVSAMAGIDPLVAGRSLGAGGGVSSLTQQWILMVEGTPKVFDSRSQFAEELDKLGETWG